MKKLLLMSVCIAPLSVSSQMVLASPKSYEVPVLNEYDQRCCDFDFKVAVEPSALGYGDTFGLVCPEDIGVDVPVLEISPVVNHSYTLEISESLPVYAVDDRLCVQAPPCPVFVYHGPMYQRCFAVLIGHSDLFSSSRGLFRWRA